MPLGLSGADRKLLLSGGGVFLALLTITLIVAAGGTVSTEAPTSYSAGSSGAKAAFLLLQSSGYHVERWERPPEALPSGQSATLILAEPDAAATSTDRDAVARFLHDGGIVIATGPVAATFLSTTVVPDPVAGLTWKRVRAISPSAAAREAPQITLAPQAHWTADRPALLLYGDDEKIFVASCASGAGTAMWWAAATPLTNAGLREPGNLEFVLAAFSSSRNRRVLWDEYFHGYRPSLTSSMLASPIKWLLVQTGLLMAIIVATYSRRSGPIIAPPAESRLSPLEFVRTLGSLYQRAGATSVAVDIAYQRFRYALARRLGLPGNASASDLERAARERWRLDDPAAFGATLAACESARGRERLDSKTALALTRSLRDYAVGFQLFGMSLKENR